MSLHHRSIYIIVFHSPIFPAHWAIWIPRANDPQTGKLLNAVGDPATGFVHEFQRNFCPERVSSGNISIILLSSRVEASHIVDGDEAEDSTIDAVALDDIERVALTIPPPVKSLNSVGQGGSVRPGRRVAIKNCQTWLRELVVALVEEKILETSAIDTLDGAPKN
ncbi:hypothetical protein BDV93DRAFT_520521 [Ceratobasidium sp. AG-I]|nr:hypothetical protein BDV93DRAFT_520521 [Ceratobasidium sp. AG-I]